MGGVESVFLFLGATTLFGTCSSRTFSSEGLPCAAWADGGLSLSTMTLHEYMETAESVKEKCLQWLASFLPLKVFNFWAEDVIAYTV